MIIPSIDLIDGRAVQLEQGKRKVLERDQPEELAEEFARYGEVAVIDLDAAFGDRHNEDVIRRLCEIADCRVGGGIWSVEKAEKVISLGAEKIIIGTMALKDKKVNHAFLSRLVEAFGVDRLIIALDTFDGEVVTRGWRQGTGLKWDVVVQELEPYASEFLFTCVEKEGLMQGTNRDAVLKMKAATKKPITAAGGVSSWDEIAILSKIGVNIQLGMALYTGRIELSDAFVASLDWEKGLIPTVSMDEASQVLMLAYSSRESLEKTFSTGRAWYFSRSRGKLWMKGETSGNVQEFLSARTDCDGDALLLTVAQTGHACHTGSYSCFGNKRFSLEEFYGVIEDRFRNPVPDSYTAQLTGSKVANKIREESEELVEAGEREDIIWEAADLLYFVSVLLAQNEITFADVLRELRRRRRMKDLTKLQGEESVS
ncbi:bifunctional phosphoribosyl-AMP cyclohydrolase/phosphoribosyl-ATP diphosphatase HisIE [Acidobacteriota bacterium]